MLAFRGHADLNIDERPAIEYFLRSGDKPRFRKDPVVKKDIHPKYVAATFTCSCGNVILTRSTAPSTHIEICNACHPFYTGKQKLIDSAGRVDRFRKRYANFQPQAKAPAQPQAPAQAADQTATPANS
jgi:large subunit ribosomal protein L31